MIVGILRIIFIFNQYLFALVLFVPHQLTFDVPVPQMQQPLSLALLEAVRS